MKDDEVKEMGVRKRDTRQESDRKKSRFINHVGVLDSRGLDHERSCPGTVPDAYLVHSTESK